MMMVYRLLDSQKPRAANFIRNARIDSSQMLLNPDQVTVKELNPRRRVYVEIPKPSRVELKCSQRDFSDTREGAVCTGCQK
jgi:hypothetical protein